MTNSPSDDSVEMTAEPAGDDADVIDDELTVPLAELEATRGLYQRALADYRNLQRRSQLDRLESSRHVLVSVVRGLLPVLDDLGRAIDSVPDGIAEDPWVGGVRLVRDKFLRALEATGITEIAALGERFDPQVHEAVGYGSGDDGTVVELVQAGYAVGDRVIRPAMVLVGGGQTTPDGGSDDDGDSTLGAAGEPT